MDMSTTRSLREVLAFPFRERAWQGRFLLGAALCLAGAVLPIVPMIFVYGYLLQVMRGAIRDETLALPAWDDWGGLLRDGLKAFVVGFVYLLPGLLVSGVGMVVYFFSVMGMALASETQNASTVGMTEAAVVLTFAAMGILLLSMLGGTLLFVLGAVPLPVGAGNLAATDSLASAFDPREVWRLLRANRSGYFLAWVVVLGLSAMLYLAALLPYMTMVLLCLVPIVAAPLGFYVMLVAAALFGLTYREARVRRAEDEAAG
jgi:hypothetical protein